jgi:hypothetical protein
MSKKKGLFWWSKHFAFGESTPLYSSAFETEKIVKILEESLVYIKKSKSPRHIVIETWLILDYFIRFFIVSGLNIDKFSSNNFNIAQELLPQSFRDCLEFLEKFIKQQTELPIDPYKEKIDLYGKFAFFVIKQQPDFYNKHFIPLVKDYYKKYYPHLLNTAKNLEQMRNPSCKLLDVGTSHTLHKKELHYQTVNGSWLNIAKKFDNKWFENVRKINKARNMAAHEINSNKFFSEFGINGSNEIIKLKKLKDFCIAQLSQSLDMNIPKRKKRKIFV